MTKGELENILACPKCKNPTKPKGSNFRCNKCSFEAKLEKGIWQLLYITNKNTRKSQKEYDTTHSETFRGPGDGSYEILASFARGNKTVDIACGQGHIEKLAPETVGVEFSQNALKHAKANGAKSLVLADAHALPFKNDSFEIAISSGNLEHFENPQKAIDEMARVSKTQILVVHRHPSIPFGAIVFHFFSAIFKIKHQPLETPINMKNLTNMVEKAGLHIVYKGVWTLPLNYGRVIKFLPEFMNLPSCNFIISIKK